MTQTAHAIQAIKKQLGASLCIAGHHYQQGNRRREENQLMKITDERLNNVSERLLNIEDEATYYSLKRRLLVSYAFDDIDEFNVISNDIEKAFIEESKN